MNLSDYDADLRRLLDLASEMLGRRALPVEIDWELEQALLRQLRRRGRRGLLRAPPIVRFGEGKPGHELDVGMELHDWPIAGGPLSLVHVVFPSSLKIDDFWAVAHRDRRRFYRAVRKLRGEHDDDVPPVMSESDRQRLWSNTIGFLRGRDELFIRYGVPKKRGVLLSGEPGNGKTMASRWLRGQCRRLGLDSRDVTVEQYEQAKTSGDTPDLFQLARPGIVQFDDFDTPLRRRETTHDAREQSTFLSQLDGMHGKSGIVYLFTSNLRPCDVDAALRRPGRIDVLLEFPRPTAALRRAVIQERWHADILNGFVRVEGVTMNDVVEEIVRDTHGLSFAELEEAKRLLILRYLESGSWDWPYVRETLRLRTRTIAARERIGFSARPQIALPTAAAEIAV